MLKRLNVGQVKKMIGQRVEYALVDVREQEEFSQEHQLLACCIPYSRIELFIETLIPCKTIPVILTDSGQQQFRRAEKAAEVIQRLGYSNVYIQEGGLRAWLEAGYETFEGVNVLSKAFGELVYEECDTPLTKPLELVAMLESGKDVAILDVRPNGEFHNMCIPDGVNTPGSEVLYRLQDQAPNPETHILVNCAGRTRGLIAAQTLINAKVPNTVSALKGGTMGWELDNLPLQYGQQRYSDFASAESVAVACQRAAAVANQVGVDYVDLTTLKVWQEQADSRTLYILDVRQAKEFSAGHYPNSRHAEGGQLVQATDEYAAVRCARYVIVDDTGARANTAATWLTQMGYPNVYVLQHDVTALDGLTTVPDADKNLPMAIASKSTISVGELYQRCVSESAFVIDVGSSDTYKKAHIPESVWVPRSRLSLAKQAFEKYAERFSDSADMMIVIVSDDVFHAQCCLEDAQRLWPTVTVVFLSQERSAWIANDYPVLAGMDNALCEADDVWYKPYEDTEADPKEMQGYFDWEYGLVEKIHRDGDAHFNLKQASL